MSSPPEIDLSDLAHQLSGERIVLAFSGLLDQTILVSLTESLNARLSAMGVPTDRIHTIHEILVEQVQNVLHHSEPAQGTATLESSRHLLPGVCLVRHNGAKRFEVSTGNIVSAERFGELTDMVEELNGMTPEQLTVLFQSTGKKGRLRPNSSSRLGLVQMARKSSAPLRVDARPCTEDDSYYYFILSVQV